MSIWRIIEQFTDPKKANIEREYEMIQGGSPEQPELAVNALLGLAARLINKYDNSSFTAENDHQMFRGLVGPLLIPLARRTGFTGRRRSH